MNFTFIPLGLPGVVRIEARAFEDDRGHFMERYKQSAFAEAGIADVFVQDNVSVSRKGVLRGLHYQLPPFDQAKLVSVLEGEIFDVVVDIRLGSNTFGRWAGETLSADNRRMLYVPCGFAHGFVVTSDRAIVAYKTTHEYASAYERGIRWDDPEIGIDWPLDGLGSGGETDLSATICAPTLSKKDRALPVLVEADVPRWKGGDR